MKASNTNRRRRYAAWRETTTRLHQVEGLLAEQEYRFDEETDSATTPAEHLHAWLGADLGRHGFGRFLIERIERLRERLRMLG